MIYNIENLAEAAGVTRRTVRYYIQRGLLDPPCGEKRGSYYTENHLERLNKIQKLAEQGIPLIHIKTMLSGHGEEQVPVSTKPLSNLNSIDKTKNLNVATCSSWQRLSINEDIELNFRLGKLSQQQINKIARYINNIVNGGQMNG